VTDNTLLIAGRFNGPPNSGNGGYCCGLLANYLGGSATVRLSNPPPLDTPLTVNRQDDATVELQWQDKLVEMGRPDTGVNVGVRHRSREKMHSVILRTLGTTHVT
jgi:hypothetical protein